MEVTKTNLDGILILQPKVFGDIRGKLVKPFHKTTFKELGIVDEFQESFFSISNKNVIRGMHFQIPPEDHAKLIYVPHGEILDVIVDLRVGSPTYGQSTSVILSDENNTMVYIPKGFAHGFLSHKDNSCTTYLQSTMRSAEHEGGIRYDSFEFDWGINDAITSDRDKQFPTLSEFKSPFIYKK